MRITDILQNSRGHVMTCKRMKHFFGVYNKVLQKHKILPNLIFNCDECGVVIDASTQKAFAQKDK